mmetsp:Transcript_95406/g.269886  ORF Transcript_95406/g.269886 Transcript_95406/m.269886 type:complete len:225 (-) Transcript_95406:1200-1874(-)
MLAPHTRRHKRESREAHCQKDRKLHKFLPLLAALPARPDRLASGGSRRRTFYIHRPSRQGGRRVRQLAASQRETAGRNASCEGKAPGPASLLRGDGLRRLPPLLDVHLPDPAVQDLGAVHLLDDPQTVAEDLHGPPHETPAAAGAGEPRVVEPLDRRPLLRRAQPQALRHSVHHQHERVHGGQEDGSADHRPIHCGSPLLAVERHKGVYVLVQVSVHVLEVGAR